MTDDRAEQAFRDALTQRAEELTPVPLEVPGHRRRTGLVVAAAVALVLGGVGVVALTADDEQAPGTDTTTAADPAAPGAGTRTVSYLDLEVDVPAGWEDALAPTAAWCIGGSAKHEPQEPYVDLNPATVAIPSIACPDLGNPVGFPLEPVARWAPHLTLGTDSRLTDGSRTFRGWTLSTLHVGDIAVALLTDETTTPLVEKILDSARVVDVDAAGCDTTSPVQAVEMVSPPAFDVTSVDRVSQIAVCLYSRPGASRPGLLGSRTIDDTDAQRLLDAIQEAPEGGGPDQPGNCTADSYGDEAVVLRLRDGDEAVGDLYVYYQSCFGNGFDDGSLRRALTPESCRPLWGGRVESFAGSGAPYRVCHAR